MTPREVWVRALRSGAYAQGQGRLRPGEDKFCCLGVAVDLYARTHRKDVRWVKQDDDVFGCLCSGERHTKVAMLPEPVLQWLALEPEDEIQLAGLNDVGCSFAGIADWIEEHAA